MDGGVPRFIVLYIAGRTIITTVIIQKVITTIIAVPFVIVIFTGIEGMWLRTSGRGLTIPVIADLPDLHEILPEDPARFTITGKEMVIPTSVQIIILATGL